MLVLVSVTRCLTKTGPNPTQRMQKSIQSSFYFESGVSKLAQNVDQ